MPSKRSRRQIITTGASAAVGFSLFPSLKTEAGAICLTRPIRGNTREFA